MELLEKKIWLPMWSVGSAEFLDPITLGWEYIKPAVPDSENFVGFVELDFRGYEYERLPTVTCLYHNRYPNGMDPFEVYCSVYSYTASRKNMKWLRRTGWGRNPASFAKWNDFDMIGYLRIQWTGTHDFRVREWVCEARKPFPKKDIAA